MQFVFRYSVILFPRFLNLWFCISDSWICLQQILVVLDYSFMRIRACLPWMLRLATSLSHLLLWDQSLALSFHLHVYKYMAHAIDDLQLVMLNLEGFTCILVSLWKIDFRKPKLNYWHLCYLQFMLIHILSDMYYFLLQSQFCPIVYLHLEINDISLGESWSIIKNQYAVLVSCLNRYSYYV